MWQREQNNFIDLSFVVPGGVPTYPNQLWGDLHLDVSWNKFIDFFSPSIKEHKPLNYWYVYEKLNGTPM